MMHPVVLTPTAADEFEAAVAWYDNEQPGIGAVLRDAVLAAIKLIQDRPLAFPRIQRVVRRARVKVFPFSVFYTVEPEFIRVIAVFHAHRNPSDWMNRVPE